MFKHQEHNFRCGLVKISPSLLIGLLAKVFLVRKGKNTPKNPLSEIIHKGAAI